VVKKVGYYDNSNVGRLLKWLLRIITLYGDGDQCYGKREKLALLTK
jgi:hypothetical protein